MTKLAAIGFAVAVLLTLPAFAQSSFSTVESATSRSAAGEDNTTNLLRGTDQGRKITRSSGEDSYDRRDQRDN